jgi:membrane protein
MIDTIDQSHHAAIARRIGSAHRLVAIDRPGDPVVIMARISEVAGVLRTVGKWPFVKRVWHEIDDDGVFNIAAAVAFYWLLALFPFLIFLLTLTPLLPPEAQQNTRETVSEYVYANLPQRSADTVMQTINEVLTQPRGGLLSIGLLTTLWAASNGMNATMTALDTCYDVVRRRNFLVQRGVAILMTAAFVLMSLLVVLLIPVTSIVLTYVGSQVPEFAGGTYRLLIDLARYTLGLFVLILLVSTIYQFGASVRRRWVLITPGAVFTVIVIAALSAGFRYYITNLGGESSYTKTYGALGGVAIMLLLFYLYAVVFLIGAEINSEIDFAVLGVRDAQGEMLTDPLPDLHITDRRAAELRAFAAKLSRLRERPRQS